MSTVLENLTVVALFVGGFCLVFFLLGTVEWLVERLRSR